MFIRIGATLSLTTQYLQLRGNTYQFRIRVPKSLIKHYGKPEIRKSLHTSDLETALKLAEVEGRHYQAEFKLLSEGKASTPKDVTAAVQDVFKNYNLATYIDAVLNPAREKFAQGDELIYDHAEPADFLSPVQMQAWQKLMSPDSITLSDALTLYLKHHQRGADKAFAIKVSRDWNALIALTGDIRFEDLSRKHARDFADSLQAKNQKTGTIRKALNILGAITSSATAELGLTKANPFKALKIQGEGRDAEKAVVATIEQLRDITNSLKQDSSPVALMIMMQIGLGSRIGEVAGLAIDDVFLDAPIPHVHIRDNPWRSLKTRESERKVPVVGYTLEALRAAIRLPRTSKGLFDAYAKPRGNDNASAAVNKRLFPWNLTSHSFRHTMKDRLRNAGCPKDIRDAIQGHASGDIAETYGEGHTLRTMQHWLQMLTIEN